MTTITISMPDAMAQKIDLVAVKEGFATRSEYIRNLLRLHLGRSDELMVFKKQSLDEIEKKLENSGRYSKRFVKSVVDGLSKSSVYAN